MTDNPRPLVLKNGAPYVDLNGDGVRLRAAKNGEICAEIERLRAAASNADLTAAAALVRDAFDVGAENEGWLSALSPLAEDASFSVTFNDDGVYRVSVVCTKTPDRV